MSDIEARYPIDGPHTPELAGQAGEALAHLVRYLNHATLPHRAAGALPNPQDVGRLLGDLETALNRLPQLFGQLGQRMQAFAEAPGIASDGDVDGETGALEAAVWLLAVRDNAADIAAAVGRARSAADRLYVNEGER